MSETVELRVEGIPSSEFSKDFLQGMVNRMGVSYYKYGEVEMVYPDDLDAVASLEQRLAKYRETGNTEWLMDVANFAMIEFMLPRHPDAHFRATDSDESPGRVRPDGVVEETENRHVGFA